jgi:Domain of unknown function (DUF4349)
MRLVEREMPLDPEVERELEAIDRALAGEPVDPDLADLADLALELRSQRPEPTAEADAELDLLAAAGFPPRTSDRLGRLRRRVSAASRPAREQGPRRLLPALGAASVFVVAISIGVSQSGILGGGDNASQTVGSRPVPGGQGYVGAHAATSPTAAGAPDNARQAARDAMPFVRSSSKTDHFTQHLERANKPAVADLSAGASNRKVAQSVDLGLSTAPDDFRDAADGVLDVVRDHRGFVVRSNVSGGDPRFRGSERGRASFTLRIPAGELSAAMGDLSDLGHVVSRSDGSVDITNRFVSARKRIDALTASRDQLLQELGQAVTITEQQSIRARLRIVQAQLASAHHDLARVQQRVHLVPVSVTIAADASAKTGGGAWTIGDAFHDAGRVLTVTAGAALVGGAALLPFVLLGAVAAAGRREWVRRQRNRALDAAPGPSPS